MRGRGRSGILKLRCAGPLGATTNAAPASLAKSGVAGALREGVFEPKQDRTIRQPVGARGTTTTCVKRCTSLSWKGPRMTANRWSRWVGLLGSCTLRPSAAVGAILIIGASAMNLCMAQVVALPQPNFTLTDANGVDLLSFNDYLQQKVISIGSAAHPLSDTVYSGADGDWLGTSPDTNDVSGPIDSFLAGHISNVNCSSTSIKYSTASLGPSSEDFNCAGLNSSGYPTWTAAEPTGSTLTGGPGPLTYTKRDGTQIIYTASVCCQGVVKTQTSKIIYPDGRTVTYYYNSSGYPIALVRNDGLELQYTWVQLPTEPTGFLGLSSITAINNAYEYCDPTATCTPTQSWPTAQFAWSTSGSDIILSVTDSTGRVTKYTMDSSDRTIGIQLPSSTGGNNITYSYCNTSCTQYAFEYTNWGVLYQNYVASVTRDGHTWTYTGNPGSPSGSTCSTATYSFTNPVGTGKTVTLQNCPWYNGTTGSSVPAPPGWDPFEQMTNEQGVEFVGPGALIQKVVLPEGGQTAYTWNGRGDLTNEVLSARTGFSGTIPLSANYNASCSNPLTCNEPNSTTDGNGNTTNYTYNASNGALASVSFPAVAVPNVGSVTPETVYTYVQRYAWVLNSSGSYVEAATPIWVRSTETYCRTSTMTSSGCAAGAADEVTKTFYYGPNSGPNNLFLRGVEVQSDGATHITCYGYDEYGNRISITKPNAGFTSLASCDQFTAQ